jgi:hypothetical protein
MLKGNCKYDIGGVVSPTLQYAGLGSAFGPIGTGVGAAVGLGMGIYDNIQQDKINQRYQNSILNEKKKQDTVRYNNLNDFDTPYMMMYGGEVYGKGGYIKYQPAMSVGALAEIENNEVVKTPHVSNNKPADGGKLNRLSSDSYEAVGNTHAEGGITLSLEPGTKIFSDKLKSGRSTFANLAKKIETKKGDVEKNTGLTKEIKDNTLQGLDMQLDNLFNEQEQMKINTSKNYKNGGMVKYENGGIDPVQIQFPDRRGIPSLNQMYQYEPMMGDWDVDTTPANTMSYTGKDKSNKMSPLLMAGLAAPYISPLVQGLETLGKREYLPTRRIDEGILDTLPGDREAELMTRSAQNRNREGLRTAITSIDRNTASPSANSNKAYLFSDWLKSTGDLMSTEAGLKSQFKTNKFNNLLNIRRDNLNQGRIEDENKLMTDANRRNIRRSALTNTSDIFQGQFRDGVKLAAAMANVDPEIRKNYMKGLRESFNYDNLFGNGY